jgi:hypothetical protein
MEHNTILVTMSGLSIVFMIIVLSLRLGRNFGGPINC